MYLKTFGFCLIVGWALGVPRGGVAKDPVPPNEVRGIDCKDLKLKDGRLDFCVKIGFPKGERVLYGGLTFYVDDDGEKYKDIYEGKVIEKKAEKWVQVEGTQISMTIEPNVDIATMVINDGEELYQLKVDLKSSEAEPDHLPPNFGENIDQKPLRQLKDRWDNEAYRENLILAYSRQKSMPISVVLNIQFVAEQHFVDMVNGSKEKVRNRIMAVVNHLKTFYSHHSLPIQIDVKILPVKFLDEYITISGGPTKKEPHRFDTLGWFGQKAAEKVSAGKWPEADTYILLGPVNDNGFYGAAKLGWELNEGVCSTNVAKKVSVNWYERSSSNTEDYSDSLLTALTVVHENGHNLGMRHDFYDYGEKPTRYDFDDNECKGVRGFMDYVFPPYTEDNQVPQKFSDCSVEDWEAHYMQVVADRGSYCLQTTCDNGPCDKKITCSSDISDKRPGLCQHFKAHCEEEVMYYWKMNYWGKWKKYKLDFKKSCKKTCCKYLYMYFD